jgi:hypothetical protein
LLHAYRRSHYRLLLWGAICFAGLTLNNVLVMFDKFVVPDQDLTLLRLLAALISISILLYGLIFDAE